MSLKDKCAGPWDVVKKNSGMIMIVGSMILFVFGLFFLISGAYIGNTFTTTTEQAAVIAAGVMGGLLIMLSAIAAAAYTYPETACWRIVLSVISAVLIVVCIGLCIAAVTFINRVASLHRINGKYQDQYLGISSVADYVNSLYTFCCTGCAVAHCGRYINGTEFCDDSTTSLNPKCTIVDRCTPAYNSSSACFFNTGANNVIPPVNIEPELCNFLEGAPWGLFNAPVVGEIGDGNPSKKVSCGAGTPETFAFSLADWLSQQYTWVSAIVAIAIVIMIWFIIASVAFGQYIKEHPSKSIVKDSRRPWQNARD